MNPPDPSNLCNVYFDSDSRSIQSFSDDMNTNANLASMRYEETRPTILTGRMKVARDTVSKWLDVRLNRKYNFNFDLRMQIDNHFVLLGRMEPVKTSC